MEGGERNEEGSLPRDYVSLAQLQERWLRKQEERKLKQKQEEEDKKRESDARAQREKNQNERGRAKTAGVIQDKGKGKEIVGGNGGEINMKRRKYYGGREKGKFKGAMAVEVKEKAEVLSGGVEVAAGGAGRAAILSGVEEIGNVSAVEVLPINGEIAHVKSTGFRKNGRNRGLRGVNGLKQSEVTLDLEEEDENDSGMKWRERGGGRDRGEERGRNGGKQGEVALDLEKEKEGENDRGMKWRGRDRGEERGRNGGRVNELKQGEVALDLEKEKEKEKEGENDRGMKWRGRNGGRVNELKQGEVALDLEKEGENDRGMKWRERDRGEERGRNGGRVNELKQGEVALDLEKEKEGENDRGMKWRERGDERGRNGGYPERRINRLKEYEPVVLTGNEVDSKMENKAEDGISEVCSEISSLNVGDKIGILGRDNKAKEGGVEGECLNGDKVAVKIEKKEVDHEVLARKSGDFGRGYWTDGNPRVGFGQGYRTNGNPRVGFERGYRTNENPRGGFERGYRTNGNSGGGYGWGRRYTSPQISDRMNSTESVKVWVKKENKLDA